MRFTRTNTGDGKRAIIHGPDELFIEIDTDDVEPEIEEAIGKVLDALNGYYGGTTRLSGTICPECKFVFGGIEE